jgi:hypothetical protein
MAFFGCSMEDPYIRALLKAVKRDLWEEIEQNHFVVIGLGPKNVTAADSIEATFGAYGLQVVFYDNFDGKHTGLDQLLGEATAHCAPMHPASVAAPTAAATPGPTARATPSGISVSAGWLDEVNERIAPKPEST